MDRAWYPSAAVTIVRFMSGDFRARVTLDCGGVFETQMPIALHATQLGELQVVGRSLDGVVRLVGVDGILHELLPHWVVRGTFVMLGRESTWGARPGSAEH